jgi:glycosyltransferase involved in cell wall biosynthesis
VVPPAQAAALADAMERLASDVALRRSCGANSQLRHRTQYSLESMMASYERLFDALGSPVTAGGR